MIEAEILFDSHHARGRVDGNGERRLARERAGVDHANDDAADQLHGDGRAVGQGDTRVHAGDAERIAQRVTVRRAVGAERCIGVDDRRARVGLAKRKAAREIGVIALDDAAGVDAGRAGRKALVHRHRRIGIDRRVQGRTIVLEHQVAADVDRQAVTVTVGIRQASSQLDRRRIRADRLILVRVDRMLERPDLVERDDAAVGVDADREGDCAAGTADAAFDHAAIVEQEDALAGRNIDQAAVRAVNDADRKGHRSRRVCSDVSIEQHREIAAGIQRQVGFVDRQGR